MSSFLSFLYSQLLFTPPAPTQSFSGKTVIVTGANVGLGFEAARHIVRLDAANVILAVRNIEKGEAAKASIESSEKCGKDVVQVWQLDLSAFESVKAFAKKVRTLPRLDAIVENAGIATDEFRLFEGHERTVTTNVISTFLLAFLVLPKLKETATKFNIRPHLTIVSSEVHEWTTLPEKQYPEIFGALDDKEKSEMKARYPVSKLLEVLTIREMFDSIIQDKEAYPVVINYVNPGLCHSELSRDNKGLFLKVLKAVLARTTETGSRTLVNAALESGPESQGQYLSDCKVKLPAPFVRSDEGKKTQQRVWKELSAILEGIQPGVTSNI